MPCAEGPARVCRAFNATDQYQHHDLIKFLESIGAPFGAHPVLGNPATHAQPIIAHTVVCAWAVLLGVLASGFCVLCAAGACTNAYTSADETVYELTVPTDRDLQLLDQTFAVLAQFASAVRHALPER